jgi:transposase InsO family protein
MPFGLTNAPPVFQTFIQDVLADLWGHCVVAYLDDILVFSPSREQNVEDVRQVLERIRAHNLYARADKSYFFLPEVDYLGFIVSGTTIEMDPAKLQLIRDWPPPSTVKEVQSFLGFANFYRRFIRGFAHMSKALTKLTVKGTTWHFGNTEMTAFEQLRQAFLSEPVLRQFDELKPVSLFCDASDWAVSGIVQQPDDTGRLHPVAFCSRQFGVHEVNWPIYDKEMFAIYHTLMSFRSWLVGTRDPISVHTDHMNLTYFFTTQRLNRRQARWASELADFHFTISHIPGTRNPADAPSRRPDFTPQEGDERLNAQLQVLLGPDRLDKELTSKYFSESNTAPTRTVAPVTFASLPANPLLEDLKRAWETDEELRTAIEKGDKDFLYADTLYYYRDKLFVPYSLRTRVVEEHHDHPVAGHYGSAKTHELISRSFAWPNSMRYVRQFTRSCDTCQRTKAPRHKPFGLLRPLDVPQRPWLALTMDHITKLPISNGYDAILVVCDRHTRMTTFIPTQESSNASELARLFVTHVFRYHGLPDSILSDRGPTFVSEFWRRLCHLLNIRAELSTAYHPQTNGLTERTNQTLESYLRAFCSYQQDDWCDHLPLAEFSFNNTVNSSTQRTPFFANYGFNPRWTLRIADESIVPAAEYDAESLERLWEELRAELQHSQDVYARYYDAHAMEQPNFQVGDLVWLLRRNLKTTRPSEKLDHRRLGPFRILEAVGERAFRLELPDHLSLLHPVFGVSLLEPYYPPSLVPDRSAPMPDVDIHLDLSDRIQGEYKYVDKILDCKYTGAAAKYLIKWLNKPSTENSWRHLNELPFGLEPMIRAFHARHPRYRLPRLLRYSTPRPTSATARQQTPPAVQAFQTAVPNTTNQRQPRPAASAPVRQSDRLRDRAPQPPPPRTRGRAPAQDQLTAREQARLHHHLSFRPTSTTTRGGRRTVVPSRVRP